MLETSNLAVSTKKFGIYENIPFSFNAFLVLQITAFCFQSQRFFGQNSTFTQNISVRALFEIF